MSAAPPVVVEAFDEVKQPPPSSSNSVVFVTDTSRLSVVGTPVVISAPTATAASGDSSSAISDSDPFGPPSADWTVAAPSDSSDSTAVADDPFASAVADPDVVVSSSPDAFAAFPKPGHVEEAHGSTKKSKKKKKKKAKQRTDEQQSAITAAPAAQPSSTVTSTAAAGSSSSEAGGDSGLLMADSAEYVAMLEQRLERLKKKQEARIKAASAKTTRRTSNATAHTARHSVTTSATNPSFVLLTCCLPAVCVTCASAEYVSITTSGALIDAEDEKKHLTEESGDTQPSQSSAVHSRAPATTTAPSTTTAATNSTTSHTPQPQSARHRTQIGLHSAPFDEDEVQAIMRAEQPYSAAAAAGVSSAPRVDEHGDVVEDEALMASSDGDAVAVVADKTAFYENKNNLDDQNCSVM